MKNVLRLVTVAAMCVALIAGVWLSAPSIGEAQGGSWTTYVFSNPDLAGAYIWTGISTGINYNWGTGAPVINGVPTGAPVDNFSVRFTSSVFFSAGNYRFTVQVDDGVRLYVDGILLINSWRSDLGLRTIQADYNFTTDGNHNITLEMFEAVGEAVITLTWALAGSPVTTTYTGTPWYGEFFNGLDLGGGVLFTASYPPSGLNLNWGQGSPGGSIPADNFSARFTRTLNVPTDLPQGVYTFYARADDNFRFWVDATLIFDYWETFANSQTYTAEVTLLTGPHMLKFEYRERTSDALLFLTWTPPNAQNPVLAPDGGGTVSPTAPTGVTATVNISVLNFRSAPSLSASVLSKLSRGQTYPVTGRTADNAWAQLNVNNVSGWVSAQYVTFTGDFNSVPVVDTGGGAPAPVPVQPTGVMGRVMGNLRVRQSPTTRSAQIGLMPWGTEVALLGKNAGHSWYMVNFNGVVGWSYAPWIRIIQGAFDQLPYTDGTQPEFPPPAPTQGVIVQAYGNMRIRSGPGLQYPKIARAVWGTRLQVLGRSTSGLWLKVRYGDVTGWTYAAWYRTVQGDLTTVPVTDQ